MALWSLAEPWSETCVAANLSDPDDVPVAVMRSPALTSANDAGSARLTVVEEVTITCTLEPDLSVMAIVDPLRLWMTPEAPGRRPPPPPGWEL